ncbi:MAG: hypothetical protein RLY57_216 [Candidatus Parcubacteria bacterium]|jgi:hypothetical protein
MKTVLGLMAFLLVVTGALAAPVVTIHATAKKGGGLTEAEVRSGQNVSIVTPAEAGSIIAAGFGSEIVVTENGNRIDGSWALTSFVYTIRINGSVALDGAGNPIFMRQFGAFNDVGSALPDFRGFNTAFVLSVPYGTQTSGGATLTKTNSFVLLAQTLSLGGANRPLLAQPGDYYSIEYGITGTVNGTPFNVKATSMVVVGIQSVWLDLRTNGQGNEVSWSDGSPLVRDPAVVEEGNTTDFVRGVRIAPTGVGRQYILVGWEATTDLVAQSWAPWNTTVQSGILGPDGSGVLNFKAVGGLVGPQKRFFRLRYTSVETLSEG